MARLTEEQKALVESLVPRARGMVRSFARHIGRRAGDYGDEMLGEVYLAIVDRASRFREVGPNARGTLINRMRQAVKSSFWSIRYPHRFHFSMDDCVSIDSTRDRDVEDKRRHEDASDYKDEAKVCLKDLTPLQREAVLLKFVGYTRSEIAEIVGATEESVKKLLLRARAHASA